MESCSRRREEADIAAGKESASRSRRAVQEGRQKIAHRFNFNGGFEADVLISPGGTEEGWKRLSFSINLFRPSGTNKKYLTPINPTVENGGLFSVVPPGLKVFPTAVPTLKLK